MASSFDRFTDGIFLKVIMIVCILNDKSFFLSLLFLRSSLSLLLTFMEYFY